LHQRLSLNIQGDDEGVQQLIRNADANQRFEPIKIKTNPGYTPFEKTQGNEKKYAGKWIEIMQPFQPDAEPDLFQPQHNEIKTEIAETQSNAEILSAQQWQNTYLVFTTSAGLYIADRTHAHERVLFEKFMGNMQGKPFPSQQLLFPRMVELTPSDISLVEELINDFKQMGFDLAIFGNNAIVVNGIPAALAQGIADTVIKEALAEYKTTQQKLKGGSQLALAAIMAGKYAIQPGANMTESELLKLCADLLNCKQPAITPGGKPVFITFAPSDLERKFS
jgi:DNA mismatch repair protein MutL